MSSTPRIPASFPSTPKTVRRSSNGTASGRSSVGSPLQNMPEAKRVQEESTPLIPTDIIDGPSQRFYVACIYVGLWAWRLHDFYHLTQEETESLWLFMKWVLIDGIFLYGIPALRIPWLEWSSTVVSVLFTAHAILDGMFMFRIGIPIESGFAYFAKLLYDRELAITERRVKPADITNNASLILGKQIIQILPEGSALLNPDGEPFCLGPSNYQAYIPIQINQTNPILIEIIRFDLETAHNETITLPAKEVRKLRREADKVQKSADPSSPVVLRYPVRKTGLYKLQKVIDESKLEVRRRRSEVVVVTCPQARIKPSNRDRCRDDLSDIVLEVEGTPPLGIKFRKTINGIDREASFQSIQPDDFVSPLLKQQQQNALTQTKEPDLAWARSQKISVPVNETLRSSGTWVVSVDEVQDAFGNVISYPRAEDTDRPKSKGGSLQQDLIIHERPIVNLHGCDSQRPLRVAKGQTTELPVKLSSTGRSAIKDVPYTLEYLYTAEDDLSPTGDHGVTAELLKATARSGNSGVDISKSGLYTLKYVSTPFCTGEVLEPSSCLLQNPPEPALSLSTEEISDKCAGNPVGLRVALNLVGTPPFEIKYMVKRQGDGRNNVKTPTARVNGLRGQLELYPPEAGHYTYTFLQISDAVYSNRPLNSNELVLEQDVKPSVSAYFANTATRRETCVDEPVSFDVILLGEGPWTLEYELIHSGKRKKYKIPKIQNREYTITTESLKNGGDYFLALSSVTDGLGCKETPDTDAQVKIEVLHERPKAYFGHIENKRSIRILDGKAVQLPLRLTGKGPWTVDYRDVEFPDDIRTVTPRNTNDWISVNRAGRYELLKVRDKACPGSIDEMNSQFEVVSIPRPKVAVTPSTSIELRGKKYIKHEICEGEEDTFDLTLNGSPPYVLKYEEHHQPDQGSKALRNKQINAAFGIASIRMETSKSGLYEYKFSELSDAKYDHDAKKHDTIVVQQRVNPRPTAQFAYPGKTYSYCSSEDGGEEVIPVSFTGVPPFYLEVEIRHHASTKPETVSIPNIVSKNHDLRIPRRLLRLGHSNISIRKVRDSRGCQRKPEPTTSPRVQISVHDAPSITALEERTDFCVGDRISFSLSGSPPFSVFYNFNGVERKATSSATTFRRLAEKPGVFTIAGVKDSASECRAGINLTKNIHEMPSVRISQGRETVVDIHEGGEAELLFEFGGTPPFEFTYTRSTNARKGKKSQVLETKTAVSMEYSMSVRASEEGTYEVIAIKDRWCSFAKPGSDVGGRKQKLLH